MEVQNTLRTGFSERRAERRLGTDGAVEPANVVIKQALLLSALRLDDRVDRRTHSIGEKRLSLPPRQAGALSSIFLLNVVMAEPSTLQVDQEREKERTEAAKIKAVEVAKEKEEALASSEAARQDKESQALDRAKAEKSAAAKAAQDRGASKEKAADAAAARRAAADKAKEDKAQKIKDERAAKEARAEGGAAVQARKAGREKTSGKP
ncbi:hypothetical protein R1sor_017753 [Riccia sorocarpa]|uniref:TolA protein n=1 Tax=Riccia sorocarpa TaxID=122646 RepID=A0ABD3IBS0_9MARC